MSEETNKIPHGEKTIKVSMYFYTNNKKGINGMPNVAWEGGEVIMPTNRSRGIRNQKSVRFRSLTEIEDAIKKALRTAGVSLVKTEGNKTVLIDY